MKTMLFLGGMMAGALVGWLLCALVTVGGRADGERDHETYLPPRA